MARVKFPKAISARAVSQVWLLTLVCASATITLTNNYIWNLLLWPMLFHGGHELLHCSLFSQRRTVSKKRSGYAELFGVIVYALFGHNYFVVRSSHLQHHLSGRLPIQSGLIDHRHSHYNLFHRAEYFASLLGINYWAYIVAGPLFLISPKIFEQTFFRIKLVRTRSIVAAQALCILWAWAIVDIAGWRSALLVHGIFSIYWGLIQNSAHYSLPVGGKNARYASRSYEVPSWISFIFFGSPFLHLEHHVFPHLSGAEVRDIAIREAVCAKLKIESYPRRTLRYFFWDLFAQFKSPLPPLDETWQAHATRRSERAI